MARYSLLQGFINTIEASAAAIVFGTMIGLIVGVLITYGPRLVQFLCRVYIDLMRGTPVLVLVLATFYVPAVFGLRLGSFWAGILALTLFCGSHVAEIARGALQAIPRGQAEAAKAIGLTFPQVLAYVLVPQALRSMLPTWINTCVELVKASTLLSVIGVAELLLNTQQIIARNFMTLPFYLFAGAHLSPRQFRHRTARQGRRTARVVSLKGVAMQPLLMQPLLQIKAVSTNISASVEVLKGVDLDVHEKEVVSIIGSSGSGKTTLLRCVNLMEEFDGGEVLLEGESIGYRLDGGRRRRLHDRELSRQRAMTGMVFQSFNLFPHLSAAGNVMLGLRKVKGVAKAEARAIAEKWLARVGLAERVDHYPSQLSGGQQQRVAIARALAMNPKLVLLDEITSALDPELVQEVLNVVKELAEEGATLLIVTHEMRFARDVSHRVVFMEKGLIAEQGPPSEIFGNPKSARLAEFLGNSRG